MYVAIEGLWVGLLNAVRGLSASRNVLQVDWCSRAERRRRQVVVLPPSCHLLTHPVTTPVTKPLELTTVAHAALPEKKSPFPAAACSNPLLATTSLLALALAATVDTAQAHAPAPSPHTPPQSSPTPPPVTHRHPATVPRCSPAPLLRHCSRSAASGVARAQLASRPPLPGTVNAAVARL